MTHSRARSTAIHTAGWLLLAVVAGLLLGGATSFAQTLLPDGLRSFANSNSGWTLLAYAAVVACTRRPSARRWWIGAGLGLVVFHTLLQGYAIVSTLRGFPDSYGPGDFYFTVASLGGPVLGLAGLWWWSDSPTLRAVGVAVFSAVMVGDGVFGLVRVSDTTGWTWWALSIAIGLATLLSVLIRRLGRPKDRFLAVGLVALGAAAFFVAFMVLLP